MAGGKAGGPAPFGYGKNGKPYAPYGYTKSGNVRKKPLTGGTRISGHGDYRIGRTYMRGRGGYWTDTYNRARGATKGWAPAAGGFLGGVAGDVIAPGIGGAIGASIGRAAGGAYSKITGWGDYAIHENSLIRGGEIVPTFGEDTIRVRKRECIAHINATTDFNNNVFPINPGLSEVFPWLSAIAQNYEQYRFNGLVFQFKSTSSDAIASTTNLGLGQVILATDYNADSSPFVNDLQMLGSMFCNSDKPSRDILHAIECAPSETAQKLFYCRSGDVPAGADARLYDLGTFQLATLNMGASYSGLGQLWISYDVSFYKSVMNNQLGFSINTDLWTLDSPTSVARLGTSQSLDEGSNLGTGIRSNNILDFPITLESGYYSIQYYVTGSVAGATAVTFSTQNLTIVTQEQVPSASNNNFIVNLVVRIDDRDAFLQWASASLPTGTVTGTLRVSQLNGEIYV